MIPVAAVEAAIAALKIPRPPFTQSVITWEEIARTALEAAAPHMLAGAWADGYKANDLEWEQTADLATPDEDRFVAYNPYR